jgi:2-methylcitrate dehydratase PrpD
MSLNITDKFIDSLYELTQIELPESAVRQAKKCLLDYMGVTYAGAKMLQEKGNMMLDLSGSIDYGVSVIGFNRKSDLYNAALINGICAHFTELDDGVRQGSVHPGAPIISALLPLTEQRKLNGTDLIRGIIVGYEASIRLATAIQPSHRNKGYHATGTCGTIGAAIGCAAALRFSKHQMKNVLSAAATNSAGMLNVSKGSSELKPFNAGQAAVSGLLATLVAQAGFIGSDDVLGGEWGLLNMFTNKYNSEIFERQSSDLLSIEKVYMKPYAACRHCHPAIEATLELRKQHSFESSQIKKINIYTYNLAVGGHDHAEINGITSAKMSTPFSVAVALITGKAGIDEFSDKNILDQEILALSKKITVIASEELNALVPEKRPAIVEINTQDNSKYTQRIELAKGEPENPLSEDELLDKFISLSIFGGKSLQNAILLSNFVRNIDNKTIGFFDAHQ